MFNKRGNFIMGTRPFGSADPDDLHPENNRTEVPQSDNTLDNEDTKNILDSINSEIEAMKEENAKLMGTITRLRGENLDSGKQIKEQLGLIQIQFNLGPKDDEGNFEILFNKVIENIPPLKAKDILGYGVFRKKILGLTGRLLPDVDKTGWELFLQENIQVWIKSFKIKDDKEN